MLRDFVPLDEWCEVCKVKFIEGNCFCDWDLPDDEIISRAPKQIEFVCEICERRKGEECIYNYDQDPDKAREFKDKIRSINFRRRI